MVQTGSNRWAKRTHEDSRHHSLHQTTGDATAEHNQQYNRSYDADTGNNGDRFVATATVQWVYCIVESNEVLKMPFFEFVNKYLIDMLLALDAEY